MERSLLAHYMSVHRDVKKRPKGYAPRDVYPFEIDKLEKSEPKKKIDSFR